MANTYTSLSELKQHLNIEETFTDEDQYLSELISVVEMAVFEYCNGGIETSLITVEINGQTVKALPKTIKWASLLLAQHLYLNRGIVSFAQGFEIPYSFKFLLNFYRIYTIA